MNFGSDHKLELFDLLCFDELSEWFEVSDVEEDHPIVAKPPHFTLSDHQLVRCVPLPPHPTHVLNPFDPLVVLGLSLALLDNFLVDLDNESALVVVATEFARLREEHRDLVDLDHAVREEELRPMDWLLQLENDRLATTCQISVPIKWFVPHPTFLQVCTVVLIVPSFEHDTEGLKGVHVLFGTRVVELLRRLPREIELKRDLN